MKWRKWGNYALVLSDAKDEKIGASKGYSISKCYVKNTWIYILWELPQQKKLGTFDNADRAKRFYLDAIANKPAIFDGKT